MSDQVKDAVERPDQPLLKRVALTTRTDGLLEVGLCELVHLLTAYDQKEKERDEALKEAFELTKALTGLTCGGSEFFSGRRSDGTYKPDILACVDWVTRRDVNAARRANDAMFAQKDAEARAEASSAHLQRVRAALEEIKYLRPAGPCRNKLVEQMERIASDALAALADDAVGMGGPDLTKCAMGVGCMEVGVCHAEANSQPDRCAAPPLMTSIKAAQAMPRFCKACQAIPQGGYCNLAGCPMPRPAPPLAASQEQGEGR